jgi:hypothetical protein
MNINGMGAVTSPLVMNAATPNVRPKAENPMAQQPMAMASESPARSATEAKGMFVDTYA